MTPHRTRCQAVLPDGTRLEVDARGLLVGRAVQAEIHLDDPSASRRHGLLYVDLEGPRLVALGRRPVRVNDRVVTEVHALSDGDRVVFPGLEIHIRALRTHTRPRSGWLLKHEPREQRKVAVPRLLPLPLGPVSAGGGEQDEVPLAGWPAGAMTLAPSLPGGWEVELARGIRGPSGSGSGSRRFLMHSGESVTWQAERVHLLDAESCQRTTMREADDELPHRVELQPLPPAGGQITVETDEGSETAFVSGLRFDLLQVLLESTDGHEPGRPLSDADILPRVWGRQLPADRKAVTVLTRRLRRDLEQGGIAGRTLVPRRHGRTRFQLARGAEVRLLPPR